MFSGKRIPEYKINYLLFLQQINRPSIDFNELEKVVRREVSLSVKLLRYLNSAAMGLRSRVRSIKHAVVLLGERPLKKWASLVAVGSLGDDKPNELVRTCLVRARFCEMLGEVSGLRERQLDLFMVGLLSTVDALMDRPMEEVLQELQVAKDIERALLSMEPPLGTVYALALAYERGEWQQMEMLLRGLRIPEERVPEFHREAIRWSDEVLQIAATDKTMAGEPVPARSR
jgi:EAL and modified HD-GYP domain-containing signal transduction protein